MKEKILMTSLAASFICLAVFGFLLMHGSSNKDVSPCVAALTGAAVCLYDNPTTSYFYMNAFHSFSNILPAVLVLLFFIALLTSKPLPNFEERKTLHFALRIFTAKTISLFDLAVHLGRWLVLREREATTSAA